MAGAEARVSHFTHFGTTKSRALIRTSGRPVPQGRLTVPMISSALPTGLEFYLSSLPRHVPAPARQMRARRGPRSCRARFGRPLRQSPRSARDFGPRLRRRGKRLNFAQGRLNSRRRPLNGVHPFPTGAEGSSPDQVTRRTDEIFSGTIVQMSWKGDSVGACMRRSTSLRGDMSCDVDEDHVAVLAWVGAPSNR